MKKLLVAIAVLFPFVAVSVEIFKGAPITSFLLYAAIVVVLATTATSTKKPAWEESLNK